MTNILKTFYLISLIAMLVPTSSKAQTGWYSPAATTDELNTVFFVDSLHGWVGGALTTAGAGVIRRTTDGGAAWVSQSLPVTDAINRIVFLTSNVGFAVGGNGAILKTTDAGTTWLQKRSGTGLQSIFFFDDEHGWACGTDTVLFTADQGETWSARLANGAIALWDVAFRTLQEGWAVGLYAGCYKTTDGGNSWSSITPPISGVSLFGVRFPTSSRGITIGGANIALSTHAGSSWKSVYNSGGSQLNSVSFSDSLNGWVIASDKIVRTTDGGYTWGEQLWPAPYRYLIAVHSPDKNHAWVVGDQIILKTTDGGTGVLPPNFFTYSRSIDFGTVAAGNTKKDSVSIVNTGSADLIISSISTTNPRFTVSPVSANLAPSTGLHVVVAFAPLDSTKQSGYIVITHNAASSPDSISLQGNEGGAGLPPLFFTSSRSIDFGTVAAGNTKKDSVSIVNTGSADLIISSISTTNPRFTVSPLSANLTPSTSLYVVVAFAPLDTSEQFGDLLFTHNAAGSPDLIFLQGNEGTGTDVSREKDSAPKSFSVSQNYPNPFNPTTTIAYDIPKRLHVTLVLYDMIGRLVKTLESAERSPGHYQVTLDASSLPSGVYFYRLSAGSFVETRKLVLLK